MHLTHGQVITLVVIGVVLIGAGWYTWSVMTAGVAPAADTNPVRASLAGGDDEAFTDLSGTPMQLEQYFGNVLVVNTWASWSPASKEELIMLGALAEEYVSDPVRVLAVNRGETAAAAQRFLQHIGVQDTLTLVLDPTDQFYKKIDGYAMPETIVYDKDGQIVYRVRGPALEEELRSAINGAL